MRASQRVPYWLATTLGVSVLLIACNSILGVGEVTKKGRDAGKEEPGEEEEKKDAGKEEPTDDPSVDKGTLALGFLHSCARTPAGTVLCWGTNTNGQVGDGEQIDAATHEAKVSTPKAVAGLSDVAAIGAGDVHTCAVAKAGTVSCWGQNDFGQLGDGTKVDSSSPVPVKDLTTATNVVGGRTFSCALLQDKSVSCWGENLSGQLGDNTQIDHLTPKPVKGLQGVVSVAAGYSHACAATASGGVSCWGSNKDGQLGIATASQQQSALPLQIASLSDIEQVAVAETYSCARQRTGKVFCWGVNAKGQLGSGTLTTTPNPTPEAVTGVSDAVWLWAGAEHTCAVLKNHKITCWGRSAEGQLGDGPPKGETSIEPILATSPVARFVYTNGDRTCEIAVDGKAYCWGANSYGQAGNGNFDRLYNATEVLSFP